IAWIAWRTHRAPPGARPDALARAYARLCAKLARAGVPRAAHEGPLAYAETIARERPDLAQAVRPLLVKYASLRYGPASANDSAAVGTFERAVARLRVTRGRS